MKELLGSGINVMLISPRRWGKSSLVKVAMDELMHEDKHIRVCFIDARCLNFGSKGSIAKKQIRKEQVFFVYQSFFFVYNRKPPLNETKFRL